MSLFTLMRRRLSQLVAKLPGGHRPSMALMPAQDRETVEVVAQALVQRLEEGQTLRRFLITHSLEYPLLSRYHSRLEVARIPGFPLFFGDFAVSIETLSTAKRAEHLFALLVTDDRAAEAVIKVLSTSTLVAASFLEKWHLLDVQSESGSTSLVQASDVEALLHHTRLHLSNRLCRQLPGRWQPFDVDAALHVFFEPSKLYQLVQPQAKEIG